MNVLLLSMPDTFEHMAPVAVRMPNGALTVAGGQRRRGPPPLRWRTSSWPGTACGRRSSISSGHTGRRSVGLSSMIFQRRTAHAVIRLVRALRPHTRIVVGGYDPEPGAGSLHRPRPGGRCHRPGRGRDDLSRGGARDGGRARTFNVSNLHLLHRAGFAGAREVHAADEGVEAGAAPRGVEPSPRIRNYRFFRLGRWTDLIRALSFAFGVDFSPEVAPLAVSNTDTNSKAAPGGNQHDTQPGITPVNHQSSQKKAPGQEDAGSRQTW